MTDERIKRLTEIERIRTEARQIRYKGVSRTGSKWRSDVEALLAALDEANAKLERVREAIAFDLKHGPPTEWGMATALADVKRALEQP